MHRCGIIEVGTRGIRLLVAQSSDKNPRGFEVLRTRGQLVNLGADVTNDNPIMSYDRMTAGSDCVDEYFREAADLQAEDIVILATEVLRQSANTEEFLDMLPEGIPVYILTPEQEAALSYRSVADSFRGNKVKNGELSWGPMLLLDLGGGSAEIVAGEFGSTAADSDVCSTLHLPELGSVSMQQYFDNATYDISDAFDKLEKYVDELWGSQPPLVFDPQYPGSGPLSIVALGSAATEIAWRLSGNSPQSFRSRDVHGMSVYQDEVTNFCTEIKAALPATREELTDQNKRDITLVCGAFIFKTVLKNYGLDHFRVCGYGLRFGAAGSLLQDPAAFPPSAPAAVQT